ncbi:hypothetical protein L195_g059050, partial [Trifolium pratense]
MTIEESVHVTFDETNPKNVVENVDDIAEIWGNSLEEDKGEEEEIQTPVHDLPKEWRTSKNHPLDNVI